MTRHVLVIISLLLISCNVFAVSPVADLARKMPEDTFVFVGTSGLKDFEADFKQTPLGGIFYDAQLREFVSQIVSALPAELHEAQQMMGDDTVAFACNVLSCPVMVGVSLDTDPETKSPASLYLVCKDITNQNKILEHYLALMDQKLQDKSFVKKQLQGYSIYTNEDSSPMLVNYVGQVGNYFIAALADPDYSLLNCLSQRKSNFKLSRSLTQVSSTNDAFVGYVQFERLKTILEKEIAKDEGAKKFQSILKQLGLWELETFSFSTGFEDGSIVASVDIKVPTATGIWNCLQPIDRKMLTYTDSQSLRAGAAHFDAAVLYDLIIKLVNENVPAGPNGGPSMQIAMVEQMLGFKIREQLLGSFKGDFMCYNIGTGVVPEVPTGGFVLAAKLKDVQAMQDTLAKLGDILVAMANGQLQVSTQKTASGKEVHIWAVNYLTMMQMIPSWAIEGDTLVIASHPVLTGRMMDQIASGDAKQSMVARPEFKALLDSVPADAFSVTLTDSAAKEKQLLLALQQLWPMARMMASQQGINLPMTLPSLDSYVEKMKPGVCYGRKTASGVQWYYKGSGVELTAGGAAVTAATAAVLMPALNKTKKIAQRVVSGTNLKGIGAASLVYANDHDGKFPESFDQLITECDLSPKSLESPRKPKTFDGPSYILIPGLTDAAPANIVLAYENPDFCDDKVNVLYVTGAAAAVSKQEFEQSLKKTYEYLGKPMPY